MNFLSHPIFVGNCFFFLLEIVVYNVCKSNVGGVTVCGPTLTPALAMQAIPLSGSQVGCLDIYINICTRGWFL